MNQDTCKSGEEQLAQVFRAMPAEMRSGLLQRAGEDLLSRLPLSPVSRQLESAKRKEQLEIVEDTVDERLTAPGVLPHLPWKELTIHDSELVSHAWPERVFSTVFASCEFDSIRADELKRFAEGLPLDPNGEPRTYVPLNQIVQLLVEWREKLADILDLSALRKQNVAVVDVIKARPWDDDLTMYDTRSRQRRYGADTLFLVGMNLVNDGWTRSGEIRRWDGEFVALWSKGDVDNTVYVAVWDERDNPLWANGQQ